MELGKQFPTNYLYFFVEHAEVSKYRCFVQSFPIISSDSSVGYAEDFTGPIDAFNWAVGFIESQGLEPVFCSQYSLEHRT